MISRDIKRVIMLLQLSLNALAEDIEYERKTIESIDD